MKLTITTRNSTYELDVEQQPLSGRIERKHIGDTLIGTITRTGGASPYVPPDVASRPGVDGVAEEVWNGRFEAVHGGIIFAWGPYYHTTVIHRVILDGTGAQIPLSEIVEPNADRSWLLRDQP